MPRTGDGPSGAKVLLRSAARWSAIALSSGSPRRTVTSMRVVQVDQQRAGQVVVEVEERARVGSAGGPGSGPEGSARAGGEPLTADADHVAGRPRSRTSSVAGSRPRRCVCGRRRQVVEVPGEARRPGASGPPDPHVRLARRRTCVRRTRSRRCSLTTASRSRVRRSAARCRRAGRAARRGGRGSSGSSGRRAPAAWRWRPARRAARCPTGSARRCRRPSRRRRPERRGAPSVRTARHCLPSHHDHSSGSGSGAGTPIPNSSSTTARPSKASSSSWPTYRSRSTGARSPNSVNGRRASTSAEWSCSASASGQHAVHLDEGGRRDRHVVLRLEHDRRVAPGTAAPMRVPPGTRAPRVPGTAVSRTCVRAPCAGSSEAPSRSSSTACRWSGTCASRCCEQLEAGRRGSRRGRAPARRDWAASPARTPSRAARIGASSCRPVAAQQQVGGGREASRRTPLVQEERVDEVVEGVRRRGSGSRS